MDCPWLHHNCLLHSFCSANVRRIKTGIWATRMILSNRTVISTAQDTDLNFNHWDAGSGTEKNDKIGISPSLGYSGFIFFYFLTHRRSRDNARVHLCIETPYFRFRCNGDFEGKKRDVLQSEGILHQTGCRVQKHGNNDCVPNIECMRRTCAACYTLIIRSASS